MANEVTRIEPPQVPATTDLTSVLQAQIEAIINVQAKMAVIRPRDEDECKRAILVACQDAQLAEKAEYAFPRGGSTVSGPTVHLLRAVAQRWKNINTQIMEIGRGGGESKVMVYAIDVENNYLEQMSFSVPHYRVSKEKGRVLLTDDRDIYEMVANQGARRQRKCLEDIIPRGVIQAAIQECHETLKKAAKATPLDKRIGAALKKFSKEYEITAEHLSAYLGKPQAQWDDEDTIKLASLFNAVRDGHVSAASVKTPPAAEDAGDGGKSAGDAAAEELTSRKAPGNTPPPTQQTIPTETKEVQSEAQVVMDGMKRGMKAAAAKGMGDLDGYWTEHKEFAKDAITEAQWKELLAHKDQLMGEITAAKKPKK